MRTEETEDGRRRPHEGHHWHTLQAARALIILQSNASDGLSSEAARMRLKRCGPNALPEPKPRLLLSILGSQFASPLIYLLLAAAAIALALGHVSDATVIVVVVLLNAIIGTFQEGRAERSLASLRKLARHTVRVVRDGQQRTLETQALVPGDVLILEAGDAVPADGRLLESAALQVAEAALTGESTPAIKNLLPLAPDTLLADRHNMVYAGTHLTAGRARVLVVATGLNTELGKIATLAEGAQEPPTPLERRVAQFGRHVIYAAAAMFTLIVGIGLLRDMPLGEILMVGISQTVGMIPEGLPVAMTVALAVGVQRMARRNAVVRRLSAVETLGATTVICSDKTGTLTRNEMTVTALRLADGRQLTVSGVGYAPSGTFVAGGREMVPALDLGLIALLEAGVLCNDARLKAPDEQETRWQPIGDPTEVALITLAMKAGIAPEALRTRCPRLAEIPFDAGAKMMATQHAAQSGTYVVVKGAPEAVIALCAAARQQGGDVPLAEETRRATYAAAEQMASAALRVLAIAIVDGAEVDVRGGFAGFADRAVLLGLVGQIDPPRSEVKDAVARCRGAGIRPVMVTGDHKATGYAIARELGIARDGDLAIDGRELEQMSDTELAERISGVTVFARVHPAQKLRIVSAYQRLHEVVAMTGDGVNDAPALVKADVGVAMGVTGTEVAKEAAKIVLSDDNFATLVAAVEEGRVVYRNIKKTVLFLVSTSAAEVFVLVLAMLLGYSAPFAAVQILWNNLVTEGLITVNLIMDPAEGDERGRPPISPDEPLLTRALYVRMGLMTPAIVLSTLGWFIFRVSAGIDDSQARTETFTLLAICEWFNVLNCRSEAKSALNFGLFRNRWLLGGLVLGNLLQFAVVFWSPLGRIFHTVPIGYTEVVALGLVGSLVLWVEELRKLIARRRSRCG